MTGIACVWHVCVCVCVCKYLDVLHAVPQLNQELLGFGGSVRQAVERLRQLTLWRAQREDVRDAAHSDHSTNSFTCIYVSLTVLQVRRDWKKNRFQNLQMKSDCVGAHVIWVRCFVRTYRETVTVLFSVLWIYHAFTTVAACFRLQTANSVTDGSVTNWDGTIKQTKKRHTLQTTPGTPGIESGSSSL